MSDTTTAVITTTRPTRTTYTETRMPQGTRVRCLSIEGSDALQNYVRKDGIVEAHTPGSMPRVRFTETHSGDNTWYVSEYQVLPMPGQQVTVLECLPLAQDHFKDWAIGRSATYISTDPDGHHVVRYADVPNVGTIDEYPNPSGVLHVQFTIDPMFTASEPDVVLTVDTAENIEERDRKARRTFERLVEGLNTTAEEQEFCGQFEEWCEEMGIESTRRRERNFTVYVDLEYEIDSDTIVSMFRREFGGDHDDVSAESVTITSSVSISMTLSGEDPTECNSYEVDNALENAGFSGYYDSTVTSFDED